MTMNRRTMGNPLMDTDGVGVGTNNASGKATDRSTTGNHMVNRLHGVGTH